MERARDTVLARTPGKSKGKSQKPRGKTAEERGHKPRFGTLAVVLPRFAMSLLTFVLSSV
jgi:hypothetical protein